MTQPIPRVYRTGAIPLRTAVLESNRQNQSAVCTEVMLPRSIPPEEILESECQQQIFGQYPWIYTDLKHDAKKSVTAALLAHRRGLARQVELHLEEFRRAYHTDVVYGHIVPVLTRHLNFQVGVLYDRMDFKQARWSTPRHMWEARPLEAFGEAIPLKALLALDTVEDMAVPFEAYWVLEPREIGRSAASRDPWLAGQITPYLVAFSFWL